MLATDGAAVAAVLLKIASHLLAIVVIRLLPGSLIRRFPTPLDAARFSSTRGVAGTRNLEA